MHGSIGRELSRMRAEELRAAAAALRPGRRRNGLRRTLGAQVVRMGFRLMGQRRAAS